MVLSIVICLIVGVYVMYETKAFWGKESNYNINTLNTTMNFMSSTNLLNVIVVVFVLALVIGLLMTIRMGFG